MCWVCKIFDLSNVAEHTLKLRELSRRVLETDEFEIGIHFCRYVSDVSSGS